MDERLLPKGPKSQPIDVITYETDMWRRSAHTIAPKKAAYCKSGSPDDLYEYNLRIEGFLLHARNLLAFLTNRRQKQTDLTVSDNWVTQQVNIGIVSGLVKRAKAVDKKYRGAGDTCYDEISKFLSHCADQRYTRAKEWDTEGIFSDLNPVIQDFETQFSAAGNIKVDEYRPTLGEAHHTATIRTFAILGNVPREPQ